MDTALQTPAPARRAPAWLRPALMAAPLVLLFVVLLVLPVGQLLLLSVYSDGAFSLAKYRQLFESSVYVDVILITLKISLWTTLLAVVAGYPVAYLISSMDRDRKARWVFWVLLSFWTSFLVRTFAWIVMLGRKGVINELLTDLGLRDAPVEIIYNFVGVMIGMTFDGSACGRARRRSAGRPPSTASRTVVRTRSDANPGPATTTSPSSTRTSGSKS